MPQDRPTAKDRGSIPKVDRRVIVKYKDAVVLRAEGRRAHGESLAVPGWSDWLQAFPGLVNRRLFEQPLDVLDDLVARAHEVDPSYVPVRLGNYIAVTLPPGVSPDAVAKLVRSHDAVDKRKSYVDPPPVEPPTYESEDPLSASQGYLKPACLGGVDSEYARGFDGGDGEGQSLVDIEWGWTLDHEDLVDHAPQRISGLNKLYYYHGAAVLGIIAAVNNDIGCVGIAPSIASIRWASPWRDDGRYCVANAVTDATLVMSKGHVLLLELQTTTWDREEFPERVPVEVLPAVFDAVRIATALEIVVVEAAGNGNVDLDTLKDEAGRCPMNPDSPDFKDSGAILVAAATSTAPHVRIATTCYGKRVDCFAWGQNVFSLTSDWRNLVKNLYGSDVGRTSSATAIVAGVALAVQGLAQVHLEGVFGARELRDILKDSAHGTSPAPTTECIGVMPDLFKIIQGVIPTPA